ncbi:MAG: hypothetical protein MJ149_01565 [Clostridia bacterium]|nr:hypothetical protein [Clostridia bacterium]
MKKFIPILTLTGLTCLLTGCNVTVANVAQNVAKTPTEIGKETATKLDYNNKYQLNVNHPENATSVSTENSEETEENTQQDAETTELNTLYSLNNDVENECDTFCQLKNKLTSAILETQQYINQIKDGNIELTNEEKLQITEKAIELKHLSRQLGAVTTELAFNLSELNELAKLNNADFDALTMKYLIVLDNLVNGNEMLTNGLQTLNSFNSILNLSGNLPPDAQGRLQYGYRYNNQPPVYKDYYIKNGQFEENTQNNTNNETQEVDNSTENTENNESKFKSNIDTYGNNNQNIDSFFNTALFDNEFMYGNNGFGYGGVNPYMNYNRQFANSNNMQNNTTESGAENINTQHNENKKKSKFKKNIDTYKTENTKSPAEQFEAIKTSVSNFFSKFNRNKAKDVDNPVYMFEQAKTKEGTNT